VVLLDSERVKIPGRQVRLQILLDVVGLAERLQLVEHAEGVVLPVGGLGHRQIIDASHLVEVDEMMRGVDDREARLEVKCRFQADPCKFASLVEAPKKILDKGVKVSAGTDATRVASYNPWVSLSWLVTGRTVAGEAITGSSFAFSTRSMPPAWTLDVPGQGADFSFPVGKGSAGAVRRRYRPPSSVGCRVETKEARTTRSHSGM
jgi:Amidohydrolase family